VNPLTLSAVDRGDKQSESAGLREAFRVKLFAKSGEANKPHDATPY
jgi:hypothetical protein